MDHELIREVSDAMHRAKWDRAWQRYGKQAVVIAAALLIVAIALALWQQQQKSQLSERAGTLLLLANQHNPSREERLQALAQLQELAAHSGDAQSQLAKLRLASEHRANGVGEAAASILENAANDQASPILASYACLMLHMHHAQAGTPKCSLEPAFQALGDEMAAIALASRGDLEAARARLPKQPQDAYGLSGRLADLHDYLAISAAEPAGETLQKDDHAPQP